MVLGIIFVAIIVFMPEGLVPGTVRLLRRGWGSILSGVNGAAKRRAGEAKP